MAPLAPSELCGIVLLFPGNYAGRLRAVRCVQRQHHCHITVPEDRPQLVGSDALHLAEPCEAPRIGIIIHRDLISLIQDHIARLRGNLLIIGWQLSATLSSDELKN